MYVNIPDSRDDFIEVRIDYPGEANTDLARVIAPMLKSLRDQQYGVPSDIFTDMGYDSMQLTFDFIDRDTEIDVAQGLWHGMLDKMIWSFEQVARPEIISHEPVEGFSTWADYRTAVQAGLTLFADHYLKLWN